MIKYGTEILVTHSHLASWRRLFLLLHDGKQHQYAGTTSRVVSKKSDKSAMEEVVPALIRH